jgi:hypothetical protein
VIRAVLLNDPRRWLRSGYASVAARTVPSGSPTLTHEARHAGGLPLERPHVQASPSRFIY